MPVRNFLSVTFDDLNAFAFIGSLYPGVLHTPNIDRVMAMGTTFENGYAQVAVCNASRTSALTGLNPGLTGVHHNFQQWNDHVDPSATLPALLMDAGFQTSLIGKVFHNMDAATQDIVSDFYFHLPQIERAAALEPRPSDYPLEQQPDYLTMDQVIAQLEQADSGEPFAMFAGLTRPHGSWIVPQEFFDLYPLDEIELPFAIDGDLSDVPPFMQDLIGNRHSADLTEAEWKSALQGYFASISFADAMLGRVLDALETNGQLDDTMILLWTDHGYHLGDKDYWSKFTLWEEAARAPFVLALPGSDDDGQRVSQPVELVDMMPTVLDLLGVTAPSGLSGRSLLPFLDDPSLTDGGVAVTTMYGSAAMRSGDWRYIRYADGSTELYDLASDPNQWTNLAGEPGLESVQLALDARLRGELEADGWRLLEAGESAVGGAGAETFVLAPGAGTASGREGDDLYFIGASDALVDERPNGGIDTVFAVSSFVLPRHVENLEYQPRVTDEIPTLIGNGLANSIFGIGRLEGRGGDDALRLMNYREPLAEAFGGGGNDELRGSRAADYLHGGAGNDDIDAWGGDDILFGVAGNDLLKARTGDDRANGGDGDDLISGGDGDDILLGGDGDDTLGGTTGLDTLRGHDGDDRLDGGEGADVLRGGAGRDVLTGGEGRDVFQFHDGDPGTTRQTADILIDFDQAADERIRLDPIDADTIAAGDQAFAWLGDTGFTGTSGELRYVHAGAHTYIEGDTDGDGVADLVIRLNGLIVLEAGDFVL